MACLQPRAGLLQQLHLFKPWCTPEETEQTRPQHILPTADTLLVVTEFSVNVHALWPKQQNFSSGAVSHCPSLCLQLLPPYWTNLFHDFSSFKRRQINKNGRENKMRSLAPHVPHRHTFWPAERRLISWSRMSSYLMHDTEHTNVIWSNWGHLLGNKYILSPFHLHEQTTVYILSLEGHTMSWKTGGVSFVSCGQTERQCVFFPPFYSVQRCWLPNMKKTQSVVFLIYVFANVLKSNMLHKVECGFQLDKRSLWLGQGRRLSEGRDWKKGWWGRVVGYLI